MGPQTKSQTENIQIFTENKS